MDSTHIATTKRLENFINGKLSKKGMIQTYSDIWDMFAETIPELDERLSRTHIVSSGYEAIHIESLAEQLEIMKEFCR